MPNANSKEEIVREKLIEVARQRNLITYSEVARLVGTSPVSVGPLILDRINRREHKEGRPLLSALVVKKDTRGPGSGFYELASSLGLYNNKGRLEYWQQKVQKVYDFWSVD